MESPKWIEDDVISSENSWKDAHEEFPKIVNCLIQDPKFGVEIGVAYGSMSIALCEKTKTSKLFAIDPYIPYDAEDTMSRTMEAQEQVYQFTKKRLSRRFAERIELIRDYSTSAVSRFSDGMFDFVFIDGCHQYDAVFKDVRAWWPKIKDGGLLCGHDFNTGWIGVTKAVTEFCLNEIKKPFFQSKKGNIWVCQK